VISHKSGNSSKVINKQPSSLTSRILVGDKPPNYSDSALAADVAQDLNVLFTTGNISVPAAIGVNPAVVVPVEQNLQGIDVGVDIAPQIQPIPVAQDPVNLPVAVNLPVLDGVNN